jgi:MFS family permease
MTETGQNSAPRAVRHDPYGAFRRPAVRRFLLGALLANIGAAAEGLAIGWDIYQRTDQALALGLVGLIQALPMLLFTLPAGYLADVFDRRLVMSVGMVGTSLTSVALALFSQAQGPIPVMYVLLFFDAAFHRLGGPAGSALLPLLVPTAQFENAVTWRTSLFHLAAVVGPAAGGLIIARSVPAAYLFSAGMTLLYTVLLWTLRLPAAPRSRRGRMWHQLAEGLSFVWGQKLVLGAVSLDLFAVLLGGAVYLLPVFARDLIQGAPRGMSPEQVLGWLRGAPAAGAIVMALVLAHGPPLRGAGRALLWSVAGFGVATVGFGVSRDFWLSWAMLFLTGLFDNVSVVVRHTLVQLRTPNEMRGRVSAVNSVFIGSSNELGGFESGLVAQWFGPVVSVVSGGVGTLLVVLGWARLFPALRRFGALSDGSSGAG